MWDTTLSLWFKQNKKDYIPKCSCQYSAAWEWNVPFYWQIYKFITQWEQQKLHLITGYAGQKEYLYIILSDRQTDFCVQRAFRHQTILNSNNLKITRFYSLFLGYSILFVIWKVKMNDSSCVMNDDDNSSSTLWSHFCPQSNVSICLSSINIVMS
jgi:hypothetical protein